MSLPWGEVITPVTTLGMPPSSFDTAVLVPNECGLQEAHSQHVLNMEIFASYTVSEIRYMDYLRLGIVTPRP